MTLYKDGSPIRMYASLSERNLFDNISSKRDISTMEIVYTEVFEDWPKRLGDQRARASIVSRIERIEDGNFGDHRVVQWLSLAYRPL